MEQRLLRARYDRKIAGVCGGLAVYFDIDPTIVRLAMVLMGIAGIGIFLYPVLWLITPTEAANAGGMPPPPALGNSWQQPYVPPVTYDPRQQSVSTGTSASGPFRFDPYTGQPLPVAQKEQINPVTGETLQFQQTEPFTPPFVDQQQQPIPPPMYVAPPARTRQRKPILGVMLVAIGLIAVANQFGLDDMLTPILLIGLGILLLVRKGRI